MIKIKIDFPEGSSLNETLKSDYIMRLVLCFQNDLFYICKTNDEGEGLGIILPVVLKSYHKKIWGSSCKKMTKAAAWFKNDLLRVGNLFRELSRTDRDRKNIVSFYVI